MGLLYGPSRLDGESDNASELWSVRVFFFVGPTKAELAIYCPNEIPCIFFPTKS